LTAADYTTPKLPVSDLTIKPDNTYGITPDDTESVQSAIESKQAALARKYSNGMSLIDQLNEKINYDKNGGYSKFKSNADNIDSIANRSMAASLSDNIKANVPENLNYDAFQKELSSRYRMADYLDAIDNKKAPVNFTQSLMRNVAKFGGAALLRNIVPGMGDLITSFAGYQMGKSFESFIENLTNPMREQFLQNMAQSNPEAIRGLQKYMSDIELQRANSLKLPPPSSGTTNAIPLEAPAGENSVKLVPAQKNPVTANPKTGKFQTTYNSSPK
jgi:hypothetical protein